MRSLKLSIAATALLCGAPATAHPIAYEQRLFTLEPDPTMPAVLEPYVDQNGEFDPGDFAWMRGRFEGDSEEEKARYKPIQDWLDSCARGESDRAVRELKAMGIPEVNPERIFVTTPFCAQFWLQPRADAYEDFAEFEEHLATTRPVFQALAAAIELISHQAEPHDSSLQQALLHVTIGEQAARSSYSWLSNPTSGAPKLSKKQAPIFEALLGNEIRKLDQRNTAWLKSVVAEKGWPTVSLVGKESADNAWLLAQHADHDPVFQLKVLRTMEPLVAEKEVSPSNHAYLYDRIMLKLSGKQRHATQVACEDGKPVPLPLEEPEQMDEIRTEIGLGTFAEYTARFSNLC